MDCANSLKPISLLSSALRLCFGHCILPCIQAGASLSSGLTPPIPADPPYGFSTFAVRYTRRVHGSTVQTVPAPAHPFFPFRDRFRIACFPFAAETPVKTKPCTVFALRTLSLSALKKSACCGHGFRRPVLPTPSVGGSPVCTPIIPRIFGLSRPFLKIFKIFCERHSVRPFASHTPSYAGAQAKGAAAQNVFAEYASRQRLIAGKSEGVSTKSAFSSGAPFSVTMTAYSSFCRSKAAKTSNTVASPLRKT